MESVKTVEDHDLVRETLDGSSIAFEKIVRRHHSNVRMFISKWIQCPVAADDISQDVFIAAYENLNRFEEQRSLGAWLIGIAKNKAKLYLRSEARRRNHETGLFQRQIQKWKVQKLEAEWLADTSEQDALNRCLEKLTPESRLLIERHYFDGKTLESIASETSRTGGSLRMMLMRIRKVLAKCIRGQQQ